MRRLDPARRYRFVHKPLLFVACSVPLLWMVAGALGVAGQSLGPDPVKELLHAAGKTALNLLLITLAVTPVRELTGWTQLLRLRRMLGLFAFLYAALHVLVYAALELGFDLRELGADIARRPYITVGFAALVLLVPLAATSTDRMMRRLGRRWQRLHRLVYLVAILAVVHFWWQVKRDVREPLLYAVALAALLGYRALRARRRRAPTASAS